jgi:hypothetical protein
MKSPTPNRNKARIRANVRRGTESTHAPLVAQKHPTALQKPMICERCGAVFLRKARRRGRHLDHATVENARWGTCPACGQVRCGEYYGRVLVRDAFGADAQAIERRVQNVASHAEFTQPERRVVSLEWMGPGFEVLTTSQKLAHRIATELRKAFGGRTTFEWSHNDGSLLAVWKPKAGPAQHPAASPVKSSVKPTGPDTATHA